jgi:hypothetical protein
MKRRTIAKSMSTMGKPRASRGTSIAMAVPPLLAPAPKIEIVASRNPRNMLPASPIKIVAGLKLWMRNPRIAPPRQAERKQMR